MAQHFQGGLACAAVFLANGGDDIGDDGEVQRGCSQENQACHRCVSIAPARRAHRHHDCHKDGVGDHERIGEAQICIRCFGKIKKILHLTI